MWNVVAAPAGTPADVVTKLSQATTKVMSDPDFQQQLATIGIDPIVDSRSRGRARFHCDRSVRASSRSSMPRVQNWNDDS